MQTQGEKSLSTSKLGLFEPEVCGGRGEVLEEIQVEGMRWEEVEEDENHAEPEAVSPCTPGHKTAGTPVQLPVEVAVQRIHPEKDTGS